MDKRENREFAIMMFKSSIIVLLFLLLVGIAGAIAPVI